MTARALLASPLGFLIGVSLGALGGGGSILAVPVLVFVVGQPPSAATSTSLVVVGVASLIGAYGHWRRGRVRVRSGLAFGLVGIAGSLAGSALNHRLDGDVLLLAFSGLTLVAAWRMVPRDEDGAPGDGADTVGEPAGDGAGDPAGDGAGDPAGEPAGDGAGEPGGDGTVVAPERTWSRGVVLRIVAAGTAVGFLTGLFGVGGGFVVVPALVVLLRFPMPAAVGTSLLVIALNAATALAARIGTGLPDGDTTLVFTAAAAAGVLAGRRVADRLDAEALQRWFAALLVAVAAYTAVQSLVALA